MRRNLQLCNGNSNGNRNSNCNGNGNDNDNGNGDAVETNKKTCLKIGAFFIIVIIIIVVSSFLSLQPSNFQQQFTQRL